MIPQKITDFYDKYKKMLYNTSLRITGDSFEAEEIMQDTVIKYLRNRKQEMSEEQVRVWLIRTCVRASINVTDASRRIQNGAFPSAFRRL